MYYTDTRRQNSLDQREEQTGRARSVDEADIDPGRRSVAQHPHPALLFPSTEAAPFLHLARCCFQIWAIDFAADPARPTRTKYVTIALELALPPRLTQI